MGNFYVNYTLKGVSQADVVAQLGGRRCVVTPEDQDCVVVFDEQSDSQNSKVVDAFAEQLSSSLDCPLLTVLNHDDDILLVQTRLGGKVVDEYDSTPDYFDDVGLDPAAMQEMMQQIQAGTYVEPPRVGPEGGDANKICDVMQGGDPSQVERVLRTPQDGQGYVFAFERHAELVAALNLPECAVGTAFASFLRDEYPDGLTAESVVMTE